MRKIDYIEDVIHKLTGGNPSQDDLDAYHPEVVANTINEVLLQVCLILFIKLKKSQDFDVFDTLLKTYTVDVVEENDKYYSVLPVSIINSIPTYLSIRRVYPVNADDTNSVDAVDFSLMDAEAMAIIKNLPAYKVMGTPIMHLKGNRLYYDNINTSTKQVVMVLMPEFNEYDDLDEVSMPSLAEASVIDMVYEKFRPTQVTPADVIADNLKLADAQTPKK